MRFRQHFGHGKKLKWLSSSSTIEFIMEGRNKRVPGIYS